MNRRVSSGVIPRNSALVDTDSYTGRSIAIRALIYH